MSEIYSFKGHAKYGTDRNTNLVIPNHDFLDCAVTSADYVPSAVNDSTYWQDCRSIWADSTGIIKIDYIDDWGTTHTEILNINSGTHVYIRNVTKVYQYYKDQTACTAKIYDSTGTLVVGVRLRR